MLMAVKVHPKSKEFRIETVGNFTEIWLTEPAEKGRANRELIKEMSKRFGSCKILKGVTSDKKLLFIGD